VYLHLWAAKTSGVRICSQVGLLTALTELNVGAMYATGTIPTQIGRLTRLEELYININYLTGTLPTQITALTRLANFLVSDNRLTGTVPPLPPSLGNLHAYHNRFTGALVATGLSTCYPQKDSDAEANCFVDLPSECAKSPTRISLTNGTSTPAPFRGCLNATDSSVFALPKSYLFTPPSAGVFAIDVAPATNLSLLLNDTVLSTGAATAFFFATATVAIGVRPPSTAVKPTITVRSCSCDGDSAVFSAALVNGSDSLVALSVNESLALQASLRPGRRVRGIFCAPAKHHYAVGVRTGSVVLKFDRLAVFSTGAKASVAQTALSLYLVPASGGTAISRVVELNTSAPVRPADVHLSPTESPAEEAVLVIAASVPLMYAVSFTLADCLMGNDSTQALSVGTRVVGSICPAGDRDSFAADVQAGNFTLTVDIGDQVLSAPLQLKATVSVFETSLMQNLTAQPACVLEAFVAHNVSSCSWALEQSAGFLSIELAADNSNQTLVDYGVSLVFVPRPTVAPTPAPLTASTTASVADSTAAPVGGCDKRNGTDCQTPPSSATSAAAAETPSAGDSQTIYIAVGVAVGAVCLIGGAVLALVLVRRRGRLPTAAPALTQQQAVPMSEFTSARLDGDDGVSPIANLTAPSNPSSVSPKSEYASMFSVNSKSAYDQFTPAEAAVTS
jgi:hypothetical protein